MTKEQIEERKQILRNSGFTEVEELGLFIKGFPREDPEKSTGSISFGADAQSWHVGDMEYCEIYVVTEGKRINNTFKGYPESLETAQQIANWMGCNDPNIFNYVI